MIKLLLILSFLLTGCIENDVNIDLKFRQEVTVHTDFYGKRCGKVYRKYNNSTYDIIGENSPDFLQFQNGVDGTITIGCVE